MRLAILSARNEAPDRKGVYIYREREKTRSCNIKFDSSIVMKSLITTECEMRVLVASRQMNEILRAAW